MIHSRGLIGFAKRQVKMLLRMKEPWLTKAAIIDDLRKLGIRRGGILMVHSSLASLGYVPGGARTVIQALLEVIGPGGTLVLPTHSWAAMGSGCRVFDARETASCVGALTEYFRKMPSVLRSLHPTHSVSAIGPLAGALIEHHEKCLTPCGPGTPYVKMLQQDAQILFLGVGLESNTAYHAIEDCLNVPYAMDSAPDDFTIIDAGGAARMVKIWRHKGGVPRCFGELESELVAGDVVKRGSVGRTRCLLMEGATFLTFMMDKVTRNPQYLLKSRLNPSVGLTA